MSVMLGTVGSPRRGEYSDIDAELSFSYARPVTEGRNQSFEWSTPQLGDGTWARHVPPLTHARSGSHLQTTTSFDDEFSTDRPIMVTSMSSMPSLKQTSRKPGGFKATIKRMFGSKRYRSVSDDGRKELHMSDPGNLIDTPQTPSHHISAPASSRPQPAMSGGALSSHAVNLPSDVRDFEPSLLRPSSAAFKRRNTLPSLVFSDHEAQSFSSRLGEMIDDQLEQIAGDDIKTPPKNKQRSKSADERPATSVSYGYEPTNPQDRESEIAFWRNSILLNPLPRSAARVPDFVSSEQAEGSVKEVPSLEHIIRPAQSFDFGLSSSGEPVDLEDRVNTLEVKMFDFEYAIAKLQGVELPKPTLPTKSMKRRNVQEVFSKPSMQSLSTATSGHDGPPYTPRDSPILPLTPKEPSSIDRSSNTTTIRPMIPSSSQARTSMRLTMDQYNTLMSMIQDEKDARQLMEMRIIDLQRELELLQTPIYATINYPPPSPESVKCSRTLHRAPPFRFHNPPMPETSRFSVTESDVESINNSFDEHYETSHHKFDFEDGRRSAFIGVLA